MTTPEQQQPEHHILTVLRERKLIQRWALRAPRNGRPPLPGNRLGSLTISVMTRPSASGWSRQLGRCLGLTRKRPLLWGANEAHPSPQLLNPPSFDVDAVAERMEHHLGYAIDQIRHTPRTMLLESRTPWCHVSLYSRAMPLAMQGEYHAYTGYGEGPSLPPLEDIYATLETTREHC